MSPCKHWEAHWLAPDGGTPVFASWSQCFVFRILLRLSDGGKPHQDRTLFVNLDCKYKRFTSNPHLKEHLESNYRWVWIYQLKASKIHCWPLTEFNIKTFYTISDVIQKILHEFHLAILHSPLISLLPASLLGHPCSWSLQHDSGQNNVFEVGTALFQPPTPCAKFNYHKCFLSSSVSIYLFVNTTPNVWRLFGAPNSPKTKMVNPSWLESGRRISKGMLPSDDSQWFDISTSFVPKTRNILFLNSNMHPSNKPQKNVEVPWAQSPQAERSVQASLVLTHISYTIKLPQFIRKILEFITLNEFLSWRHPSLVPPRPVASISHFIAVHKGIIMPTCPWASMERREVVWEKLFPTGGPPKKKHGNVYFLRFYRPPGGDCLSALIVHITCI